MGETYIILFCLVFVAFHGTSWEWNKQSIGCSMFGNHEFCIKFNNKFFCMMILIPRSENALFNMNSNVIILVISCRL